MESEMGPTRYLRSCNSSEMHAKRVMDKEIRVSPDRSKQPVSPAQHCAQRRRDDNHRSATAKFLYM